MVYAFIVLISIFLYKMQFNSKNTFYDDYISINTTTAINGIFVALVFMNHLGDYINHLPSEVIWFDFRDFLGQLIVVPFLFYSGYGMMCSYEKKGTKYIKGIFKNRFLKLLIHFDLAVVLFAIMNLIIGEEFTLRDFLPALTTWGAIGNSNWYITAMLTLYLLMIVSFMTFKKHKFPALLTMTILTLAVGIIFILIDKPVRYYNTIILFPLGMWYAYFKKYIDKIAMKNNVIYIVLLTLSLFFMALGNANRDRHIIAFEIFAISFMAVILLLSMKIKLENPILNMLGKHVFSIYILQRIPMTLFQELGLAGDDNHLLFFASSFAATVFIAVMFDKFTKKLDFKLFAS